MRYTTAIDISEMSAVYKCISARLVYLHLCLRCGYHDEDRDIIAISVRRLAREVGITVSAARHALKILEKYKLIEQREGVTIVRKFLAQVAPSPRTQATEKAAKANEARKIERQYQEQREQQEAQEKAQREKLKAMGKTPLDAYIELLEERAAAGDAEAAETLRRRKIDLQRIRNEKSK